MLRGKQRKIRAPGVHPPKRHECAATDWRTGTIVRIRSKKRNAEAFCRLAQKCLTRSARRKRRVIIVVDRARIHTPEGSRLVAELLETYDKRLRLRYLPSYSPECMPMETFFLKRTSARGSAGCSYWMRIMSPLRNLVFRAVLSPQSKTSAYFSSSVVVSTIHPPRLIFNVR